MITFTLLNFLTANDIYDSKIRIASAKTPECYLSEINGKGLQFVKGYNNNDIVTIKTNNGANQLFVGDSQVCMIDNVNVCSPDGSNNLLFVPDNSEFLLY